MKIIKGIQRKPFAAMIYGPGGVGKTTFCKDLPKPLFIGADELDELDADKLPKCKSWIEAKSQLTWILNSKPEYKTICVDTIDSLEILLHQSIIESDKKGAKNMAKAHGGYGAAYSIALSEMTEFRDLLASLRENGYNIMLLCHSTTKRVSDPVVLSDYDEYKLTLHEKVENLFVDWVSAVIFLRHETVKDLEEKYAFGSGKRVAFFEKRPGYVAKNRYNLPSQAVIDNEHPASVFLTGLEDFYNGKKRTLEEIRKNIIFLSENISDQQLLDKIKDSLNNDSIQHLESVERRVKELING